MASQDEDGTDPSDGTSFTSIQDASAFTALQMLSGSTPSLIPLGEVATPTTGHSQTELSLSDDALFKNYMSQLQGLSSTLVMSPQEMSLPTSAQSLTSDSTLMRASLLPNLTTMVVSSNNLLSMPISSSPASVPTSNLATSNLIGTPDVVTLTAPHLPTMMTHQASGEYLQHQFSISTLQTEHALAPSQESETDDHGDLTSSQLDPPLESLVNNTVCILEEASREIHAKETEENDTQGIGGEDVGDEMERGFSVTLYDVVPDDDDDGGPKSDEQPSILDENGEYKEEITKEWSQMFTEQITPYFGYVETIDDAKKLLKNYEMCTGSKFLAVKRCDFNKCEIKTSKARPFRYTPLIICGEKIPFDGVPYYHGGKGMYNCQFGTKRKDQPGKPQTQRKKQKQSKKVGCTARAALRVVARFPEYKLKENTEYNRLIASQGLLKALTEEEGVAVEWRVYIMLPKARHHSNHEIIPTLRLREEPLDRRVVGRICQLIRLGLTDSLTIQKQVAHFAEQVLTQEGMEWRDGGKEVCNTRQVWWYRKQIAQLMKEGKFEDSKFAEMVQDVEELSRKHGYTGCNDERADSDIEADVDIEGSREAKKDRWRKRADKKKKKSYEKQLKELQVACFAELERITRSIQACNQVEVLAKLFNCIKSGRETFEKELTMNGTPPQLGGNYEMVNEMAQVQQLDRIQGQMIADHIQMGEKAQIGQNHRKMNLDHFKVSDGPEHMNRGGVQVNQALIQAKQDQLEMGQDHVRVNSDPRQMTHMNQDQIRVNHGEINDSGKDHMQLEQDQLAVGKDQIQVSENQSHIGEIQIVEVLPGIQDRLVQNTAKHKLFLQ